MADRFCPNCGTEVEADARFCPSCGTTLTGPEPEGEIPAAPAWPPPPGPEQEPSAEGEPEQPTMTMEREPEAASSPPPPPVEPPPPAPPVVAAAPPPPPAAGLPFTWPAQLSGWLIGAGSVVGALALIPRLTGAGYLVSMLLFLALLGIAATVFLADHMPAIPQLRLLVLCAVLIGLGVGLARAAFTIQGIDTIFLVAMLAAAGGALLIELDRDRPFPPPERSES